MPKDPEKQIKTFQRTSKMKYICSEGGTILFQSNNKAEFMAMREKYLKSIENKAESTTEDHLFGEDSQEPEDKED